MLPLRQGIGNCPKHQWRRVISARVLLARLERALRATAGLLHVRNRGGGQGSVIPSHDPSRTSRLRPVWRKLPSLRSKSRRARGLADFHQRFFGETPSQKTPDIGLTSIRVAKLGKRLPRGPPNEIGHLCGARPTPRGDPPQFPYTPYPPKALVVVDVAELAHKPMPAWKPGCADLERARDRVEALARPRRNIGGGAPARLGTEKGS
jgi:hypothetical protein